MVILRIYTSEGIKLAVIRYLDGYEATVLYSSIDKLRSKL